MVNLIQAVFLSIVQGICEWFPISSSGHLAIFQKVFGFENLAFAVFLHFASVFAVLVLFWKDIVSILNLKKKENWKYILLLLLGIIPAGIVGLLFKNQVEGFFSSFFYLGLFFIFSGVLVYSTKFFKVREKKMNWLDSLFIGIFQAIAILPGISRSGSTISAGLFRGIQKEQALKFSFLMAIPLIFGAGILEFKDLNFAEISYWALLVCFIVTFLVSLFTIEVLLKIVKSDKFYLFGIYNFVVGFLVLGWSFVR
ncbi:undecaprenyl-diphosphate phosphatase [Candidatus Pacearchaeota archaeon]|nr:undecaprenyl-diphosphate phosphatase [Candidatus Pacearchaeota archaeon]